MGIVGFIHFESHVWWIFGEFFGGDMWQLCGWATCCGTIRDFGLSTDILSGSCEGE